MESDHFREKLLQMRAELNQTESSSLDAGATVQLDQSRVGRLSRMDALQAQAISQETERRRQQQLRAIAVALKAIDEGCYGICEDCDEAIAPARLEAAPTARLCVSCAEKSE